MVGFLLKNIWMELIRPDILAIPQTFTSLTTSMVGELPTGFRVSICICFIPIHVGLQIGKHVPCVTYIIYGLTFRVGAGIFRHTAIVSEADKHGYCSYTR